MTLHDDIFGRLSPFSIGFDRMLNQIETMSAHPAPNYPPYNIIREDDENYLIELAVAGFGKKDISVEMKENNLIIKGDKEKEDRDKIHSGLSARSFSRSFILAPDVIVKRVDLIDGILTVKLEKFIPEEKKPKSIEIGKDVSIKSFLAE